MRSRRLVFSTAAVAVLALIIIGVGYFRPRKAESQAPAPVPVTAAIATRTDVPVIINAIGNVQSIDIGRHGWSQRLVRIRHWAG